MKKNEGRKRSGNRKESALPNYFGLQSRMMMTMLFIYDLRRDLRGQNRGSEAHDPRHRLAAGTRRRLREIAGEYNMASHPRMRRIRSMVHERGRIVISRVPLLVPYPRIRFSRTRECEIRSPVSLSSRKLNIRSDCRDLRNHSAHKNYQEKK